MRFLIVDDHPITRLGVRQLIESAWSDPVIDEAESIADAVERFTAAPADVVVLDLNLPDAVGLEGTARMLRLTRRGAPILVLSQQDESSYAGRLLQLGVKGFLPKQFAAQELVHALRRVLEGGRYVTPTMADRLLGLLDGKAPQALPHDSLSAQEFRITQLIAAGRTAAQIAELMHLSVKTVSSYRARILAKTGWDSTAELTRYCVQHGLTGTE